MKSKTLIEELSESIENDRQKLLIEKFKQKTTLKELKEEVEKQIQEDLDETQTLSS